MSLWPTSTDPPWRGSRERTGAAGGTETNFMRTGGYFSEFHKNGGYWELDRGMSWIFKVLGTETNCMKTGPLLRISQIGGYWELVNLRIVEWVELSRFGATHLSSPGVSSSSGARRKRPFCRRTSELRDCIWTLNNDQVTLWTLNNIWQKVLDKRREMHIHKLCISDDSSANVKCKFSSSPYM